MSEIRSCQISDQEYITAFEVTGQECITAFEVTGQGYITAFEVTNQEHITALEVLIPGLQGATAQPLILSGPALAGRTSGTGGLESIGLGSGLSIVNGVLTLGIQGTVTSVGLSVPTGFSVSNSPVTSSGTLGISFSPGYSLPQTSKQAEWNTAYAERLRWDGGSGGLDAVAARSSLGLGSAALSPTSAFANAAQGQLADTAVQPVTLSSALASKVDTTDPRLSDAREWTASTIQQAEAESGTSTTRRAFTAQRVFQAIAAWWNGSSAKTKLDGIQAGAEVNVNADWNATSGDAQILNKPAIPSGADAVPQTLGTAAVGVSNDYAREDHVHAMPTAGQVGAAAFEHVHGNITNAGAIGSTSGVPIITGANGVLQAGSFGAAPGTFAQGNDARFHDSVTLSASVADILSFSGQELQADNPGGDRLYFWDSSEGKARHLQLGTNLNITDTTLNAAGGGGATNPHVAWVTPTKIAERDIAKSELIAHKDVVCHINQNPARDLTDAELSSPAWQPNTQYEIGDVVSLAANEGLAPGYHHFALSCEGGQYYAHLDGYFLTNQTQVTPRPFMASYFGPFSNAVEPGVTQVYLFGITADSDLWTRMVEGTLAWRLNNQTPESLGITWTLETNEANQLYLQLSDPIPPDGSGQWPTFSCGFAYTEGTINIFTLFGNQAEDLLYGETRFSGIHLVKGQSLYTSANFTPPAGPIQPNSNSVLLLNVASEASKLVDATGRHTIKVLATDAKGQELSEIDPEIVSSSGRNYLVLPASIKPDLNFNRLVGLIVADPSSFAVYVDFGTAVNNSIKLTANSIDDHAAVIPPSLYTINNVSLTRKFARFSPNSFIQIFNIENASGDFFIEFWYLKPQNSSFLQAFAYSGANLTLGFTHTIDSQMVIRGLDSSSGSIYFDGPQKDYTTEPTHIAIARMGLKWRIWVDGQISLNYTASEVVEFSSYITIGTDTHPESGGSLLRDFSFAEQAPFYFTEDSFEPTIVATPAGKKLLLFSDQDNLLSNLGYLGDATDINLINATSLSTPLVRQYEGSSIVFDESLVEQWWPEGVGEQSFDLYWQTAKGGTAPAYGANYSVRLTTEEQSDDFILTGDFTFEMYFYAGEIGAESDSRAQAVFGNSFINGNEIPIIVDPQIYEWSEYRYTGQIFSTSWGEAFNIIVVVDGEPIAENAYSLTQGVDHVSIVFAEPIPANTEFNFTMVYEYLEGPAARIGITNKEGYVYSPTEQLMDPLTWPLWPAPSWYEDLWMAYRPCVIEVEADREIDWSQAVQDGRVQINDNFFAVYSGRAQFYDENEEYRYGDITIEPHEDPAALGAPSDVTVYQFRLQGNENYDQNVTHKYGTVFLWDDSTSSVVAYQIDPGITAVQSDEELWLIDHRRVNYILKEIDGHLTLWATAWFYQVGGLSGNTLPTEPFDPNDNFRFDGNMYWKKLYSDINIFSSLNQQFFVLPFDGEIPDGARLNFPVAYALEGRYSRIFRLGFSTWFDEGLNSRGGHYSTTNEQGLQVYWHRYLGMWTIENT